MEENDLILWSNAIFNTFLVKTSEFCIPPKLFKELHVEIQELHDKILNVGDSSCAIFRIIQDKVMQYIISNDYLDFLNKNRNIFLCVLTSLKAEENEALLEQINEIEELKRRTVSEEKKPVDKTGFTTLFEFPKLPTHRSSVINSIRRESKKLGSSSSSPNRHTFQRNRNSSISSIKKTNMPLPFWRLTVQAGAWIPHDWWLFVEEDSISDISINNDDNNSITASSMSTSPLPAWALQPTHPKEFFDSILNKNINTDNNNNNSSGSNNINIMGLAVEESLRSFNAYDENKSTLTNTFAAVKREDAFIQPYQYINNINLGKVLLTGLHDVKYHGKRKSNQSLFESYNTVSTEYNLNSNNEDWIQQYVVLFDRLGKGLLSFYNPSTFVLQAIIHLNCVKEICPTDIVKNKCLGCIDITDSNGLCWQLFPEGLDDDDAQGMS
jgi:hypothetical protein